MNSTPSTALEDKYHALLATIRRMDKALIAFSGGVDSTFLVMAVQESGIPYLAVTATSPTMPSSDLKSVHETIHTLQLNHRFIESGEIQDPNFVQNQPDRCYYCKQDLFQRLTHLAQNEGYTHLLDGTNTDDMNDYRPGLQAKQQFQVHSPLQTAGLNKQEIRLLSQAKGLTTWDRPASPCLSSRITYGEPILIESLRMVENAEKTLKELGFTTLRVRKQGQTARIEVTLDELPRLLEPPIRSRVTASLKENGFQFITVDLEGFQSGKLNRVIPVLSHAASN